MRPLAEDTLGDKVVRFLIGAVLGAGAGVLGAVYWSWGARDIFVSGAVGAVFTGFGAVLFGNRFIEEFLRDDWWG